MDELAKELIIEIVKELKLRGYSEDDIIEKIKECEPMQFNYSEKVLKEEKRNVGFWVN